MAYQTLGLKEYNKASYWQLSNMLKNVDEALNYLKSASRVANGPIKIVDYGCSEGLNSAIFFYELIKKFRTTSDQCIEILHNDVPNNNWNTFFNTINTNDSSYLKLDNIYYSALGRSFFEDVVAPQSVHFGFTAHSFHYLSQRSVRKEGEKGILHSAFLEQSKKDVENLISKRINELAPGGIFYGILVGRSDEPNQATGKIFIGGFLKLLELGLVTQEEFDNFELTSFPIKTNELSEILAKFSDQIEVLALEIEKVVSPFYIEYLEDKNVEKYANTIVDYLVQLGTPNLHANFSNKDLVDVFREEVRKLALNFTEELYFHTISFVIKKNN